MLTGLPCAGAWLLYAMVNVTHRLQARKDEKEFCLAVNQNLVYVHHLHISSLSSGPVTLTIRTQDKNGEFAAQSIRSFLMGEF